MGICGSSSSVCSILVSKGAEIAIVDADDRPTRREHARQLVGVVQFDERVKSEFECLPVQSRESVRPAGTPRSAGPRRRPAARASSNW